MNILNKSLRSSPVRFLIWTLVRAAYPCRVIWLTNWSLVTQHMTLNMKNALKLQSESPPPIHGLTLYLDIRNPRLTTFKIDINTLSHLANFHFNLYCYLCAIVVRLLPVQGFSWLRTVTHHYFVAPSTVCYVFFISNLKQILKLLFFTTFAKEKYILSFNILVYQAVMPSISATKVNAPAQR